MPYISLVVSTGITLELPITRIYLGRAKQHSTLHDKGLLFNPRSSSIILKSLVETVNNTKSTKEGRSSELPRRSNNIANPKIIVRIYSHLIEQSK